MATKKQKRRRDKERRHEYEYVYVDDEGQEVEVDEPEPERKNGKAPAQKARQDRSRPHRRSAVVAPNSAPRRDLLAVDARDSLLLRPRASHACVRLFSVALLMVFFIPFSYFMDTLMFRLAQKRAEKARGSSCQVVALAVDRYELGPIGTNGYVVRAERTATEAVVFDPGGNAAELRLELAQMGATCAAILVTHTHWDHLGGVADLAEGTGAPVYAPEAERDVIERPNDYYTQLGVAIRGWTPEHTLAGGETVEAAGISFEVVHVPGHSPGHLAYYADGALFSGDVLFAGSVGRTDLPRADWDTLLESIRIARRALSARDRRLLGPRPSDDAGGRAVQQPLPRGAARTVFEAPRGTHDNLPSEQPAWRRVIGAAEDVCRLYGYRRIDTPAFEDTEVFARTSGDGSDVVQKEMYTFEDRGGRSLTLRPEATAPIVRAYLEHGMYREPQPVKLYTVGPMWRYAAPQRGRYREHWQLSVEAIGSDDPADRRRADRAVRRAARAAERDPYELQLNSIGDGSAGPATSSGCESWLDEHEGDLDDDARQKRAATPLRVFDTKNETLAALLADAPTIGEALCDACQEHFDGSTRLSRRFRRHLPPGADARPRSRLLHADDVRVRRRSGRRAVVDLRRWAVRLPRRGAGWQAHAGHRVRRRHRAAAALAR